jgi:hypothetical protein
MTRSSDNLIRFDWAGQATDLLAALSTSSYDLCVFTFGSEAVGARPLTAADADLHHHIANLPASGRLTLAFLDRPLMGRDLALALRCMLVAVGPRASLSSGFGQPGSGAAYAAAASRVGTQVCETLVFGATPAGADQAVAAGLASFAAADVDAAIVQARARLATMLCVAKANLITWPFSHDAASALVDP